MNARKLLSSIFASLVLLPLVYGLSGAAYTGPNRFSSPDERNPDGDYLVLHKTGGPPGGFNVCTLDTSCSTDPSPEQQEFWCGSGTLHAPGWCSAHPGQCWSGTVVTRHCDWIPGVDDPPATISAAYSCALPGSSGWCRAGARIDLSAHEPVGGRVITRVEGNIGGSDFMVCDPGDAASVSCTWTPPQGAGALNAWAHSTYGDTSSQTTVGFALDSLPPVVSLTLPAPDGSNGWYRSALDLNGSLNASDAVAGVSLRQVAVDGGAWMNASGYLSAQGTHTLQGRAEDRAGNSAMTAVAAVRIDTLPPALTLEALYPDGLNGWFITSPQEVNGWAVDATSGLATWSSRINGGAWQEVPARVSEDGTHLVEFSGSDLAGNLSNESTTLRIDTTPPTPLLQTRPADGQNGWYITPLSVLPGGEDATSGIAAAEFRLVGSSWQSNVLLLEQDGIFDVQTRAQDAAGNTAEGAATLRLDTRPPQVQLSQEGALGKQGWYGSMVEVSARASDNLSGVWKVEGRVEPDDAWRAAGQISLSTSGIYPVEFRAIDFAGLESEHVSVLVKIDLDPPVVEIGSPLSEDLLKGKVEVRGTAHDGLSGIDAVEISVDGGATWRAADLRGTQWTYPWDTLAEPGSGKLLVRAVDLALNATEIAISPRVSNRAPQVDVQALWMIWERGSLAVSPGDLPLDGLCLTISDTLERFSPVSRCLNESTPPETIAWDRRFADGTLAPPGRYPIQVRVWDIAGQEDSDFGEILIPEIPPTGTATATLAPAQTLTPHSSPTVTATAIIPQLPTRESTPIGVGVPGCPENCPPEPPGPKRALIFPFWTLAALSGLGIFLGASLVFDRRPQVIHKIAASLRLIAQEHSNTDNL